MSIKQHVNGNLWSIIVTSLVTLTLGLGALGYNAIIDRLEKMETKIDNTNNLVNCNTADIARHDERIKSACEKIDNLEKKP